MINSRLDQNSRSLTISVAERFDYSVHKDFRDAYKSVTTPKTNFSINLSATKYIDSSALGMLLLAKEHADNLGGSVTLVRPSDASMKILKVASFDTIFNIS